MRIELIPLHRTDVDRGIAFFADQLGFGLDHDVQPGQRDAYRAAHPPGSAGSIVIATGMSDPDGPAAHGTHLVVDHLDAIPSSGVVRSPGDPPVCVT